MSLRRKLLAYGLLGVLGAAIGWVWVWATVEHRLHDDMARRPHPYPEDRYDR